MSEYNKEFAHIWNKFYEMGKFEETNDTLAIKQQNEEWRVKLLTRGSLNKGRYNYNKLRNKEREDQKNFIDQKVGIYFIVLWSQPPIPSSFLLQLNSHNACFQRKENLER